MAVHTRLTEFLHLEHPIVLAPMARVSGGALAAAVSRAGGLGLIGGGYGDRDWLETEFDAAGSERVGVGFITWSLAKRPALLDWALARTPAAVMLSFGDPRPFAETVRQAGIPLICQVQSVAGAKEAAAAGADIIVAQGTEAGGHGATRGTFALVPAVVDAVAPLPVVAAGGIADGRGVAAALMLGATGALIGTRFLATDESLAHDDAKKRIVEASGDDTLRTIVFDIVRGLSWPEPFTGRALRNTFTERWHGREKDLARNRTHYKLAYESSVKGGDFDEAAVFAGEGVDLISAVEPASRLVKRIAAELGAALAINRRK